MGKRLRWRKSYVFISTAFFSFFSISRILLTLFNTLRATGKARARGRKKTGLQCFPLLGLLQQRGKGWPTPSEVQIRVRISVQHVRIRALYEVGRSEVTENGITARVQTRYVLLFRCLSHLRCNFLNCRSRMTASVHLTIRCGGTWP